MSIKNEIERIEKNVADAVKTLQDFGSDTQNATSTELPTVIDSTFRSLVRKFVDSGAPVGSEIDLSLCFDIAGVRDYAFCKNTALFSIILPASVTSIGLYAFDGCTNLHHISMPNSITSIGDYAFRDSNVGIYNLPSSLLTIGIGAFTTCDNVRIKTFPISLTSMGESAFSYCTGIESITFEQNAVSLGKRAFSYCTALKKIDGNATITLDGTYGFSSCEALETIGSNIKIPAVKGYTFLQCKKLQNLPGGMVTIDSNAFRSCFALTEVTLDGVTLIGTYAFGNCTGVIGVDIRSDSLDISTNAFYSCSSLQTVTISAPGASTTIGATAFRLSVVSDIFVSWSEGEVANAPWGATNATIHYNSSTAA